MKPHPHTTAFINAIERSARLPSHEKARLIWRAWIHWSSRSVVRCARRGLPAPNFYPLMVD